MLLFAKKLTNYSSILKIKSRDNSRSIQKVLKQAGVYSAQYLTTAKQLKLL